MARKSMTWKDLKEKIAELSEEQLKGQVCFQDNYDNLMNLRFYTNTDSEPMINEEWETRVEPGAPLLGQ